MKRLAAAASFLACAAFAQDVRTDHVRRLLIDWGGLTRYGSEDTEVPAPKPGENRVVFLGDDIIEHWPAAFFASTPYFNRGISGQTSAQMLVRFRQDVISLQPKAVLIEAGTNDLAGVTGPMTDKMTIENLMTMTELAKVHKIRVILASVTPVCDCYTRLTGRRPQGRIIGMNGGIKDYAASAGAVYLDVYAALAEGRNFKKDLTDDGLIPNEAGYRVMEPLTEKAIHTALSSPPTPGPQSTTPK